jgi:hypothetical protein
MTFHRRRHHTLHPVRTVMRLLGLVIFTLGSLLLLQSLQPGPQASLLEIRDNGPRSTPVWLQWPQAPASTRLIET